MTFGETIKTRRLSMNMYQKQIADRMGITCSAVQNWEKGLSVPTPAHLEELATILGLDPIELAPLSEQAKKLSFERAAKRLSRSEKYARVFQSPEAVSRSNTSNYESQVRPVGLSGWVKFIIMRILGR